MNAWDEVRQAIALAKDAEKAIAAHSDAMTELLIGNLWKVSSCRLARLKRELRDFNIQTREWKS